MEVQRMRPTAMLLVAVLFISVITAGVEIAKLRRDVVVYEQEAGLLLDKVAALERGRRDQERRYRMFWQTYQMVLNGDVVVLSASGFTSEMYEAAWSALGAFGLMGTGDALARAESRWGVNSLVLAAIAYLESAGGESRISREKNNLFGLGAYDADPYECAFSFKSKEESIDYIASLLKESYLSEEGPYYCGSSVEAVGENYATDPEWASKVMGVMKMIADVSFDRILTAAQTPGKF